MKYICFSPSTEETAKFAISKGLILRGDVFTFCDDLSIGPLVTNGDISERKKWLENVYFREMNFNIDGIYNEYKVFEEKCKQIKGEQVYILFGENALEYPGLLYTISLIDHINNKITIVNFSGNYKQGNSKERYKCSMEVAPEEYSNFIALGEKLTSERKDVLLKEWDMQKNDSGYLRIFYNGKLINKDIGYFDEFILNNITNSPLRCTRIVGECIGASDDIVGDVCIFWRIKDLIKRGLVQFTGEFGNMRRMEVYK
ncbi:DUF1835 domain-containing protein [Oceanirhabdus sp. W0125-5]|uniref:DUF1835 domain-containing protein n=1 Tax=Oceanirhabdus sp. W0125-5 TaxID=2999116 RepID=UPI0022F303DA|nr:DUF1835 domain-containing protein [Oceanirhabdus sp. W0125-5]WBW96952.1 DUF3658 domain-containing protein [Oceanirhabdus sp. W0125-5]